ncbi:MULTISPECIES: DUF2536 family protein [Paenibacillus]|uniref:DUF2536 family protein n=1 Tax=Paenibacillus TaxID=44249 RepID=UPI00203ED302|nr:DUF2536 family protein [Paenibacillus camelliae]MCM3632270.1 YrzA family protein [Paenibacillus camelliae]
MEFRLDLLETKVEFYEAFSLKELEAKITEQIDNNKALMLEPAAIQHQAVFHPLFEKMLYTAHVHYKLRQNR